MIDSTRFGQITIDGTVYDHDVVILSDGTVKKRKKKLSKKIYGSSHTVALDEIRYFFEKGVTTLVVGTGQQGILKLSDEAESFLKENGVEIQAAPTPKAIKRFNQTPDPKNGLFHITC